MQEVNQILEHYHHDPSDIIAILQDVQHTYRYLPEDVLQYLSNRLDIPLSRVYHLATFFRAFSLEKRGRHVLHVCMGTACHVRGSPRILEAMERELKIKAGKTKPDFSCTLETVNCVGACALGPVIVADDKSLGKMTPQKAERMLRQMGLGRRPAEKPAEPPAAKADQPDGKAAGAASPAPASTRKTDRTAGKAPRKGKPARSTGPRPAAAKPPGKKAPATKPAGKKAPTAKPAGRKAKATAAKSPGKKATATKPVGKKTTATKPAASKVPAPARTTGKARPGRTVRKAAGPRPAAKPAGKKTARGSARKK